MTPVYLGDGVYVTVDRGMVRLTTDGNTIYLDAEVMAAFLLWWQALNRAVQPADTACPECAGTGEIQLTREVTPSEATGGLSVLTGSAPCPSCSGAGVEPPADDDIPFE